MPVQLAAALRDDAGTDQIMERTGLLAVVAAKIMWHEDITARIGRMVFAFCRQRCCALQCHSRVTERAGHLPGF